MKRGIRFQLFAMTLSIGLIPILLTGIILVWLSWNRQVKQSTAYQKETGLRAMGQTLNFIQTSKDHLGLASTLFNLPNLAEDELRDILALMASHQDETHNRMFKEIALFDANANIKTCFSRANVCTDTYIRTAFSTRILEQAISQRRVFYGPIQFDPDKGTPSVTIASPIIDHVNGQLTGVLAANIRIKELWDVLSDVTKKTRMSAYLLADDGRVVAHPDPSIVLRETFFPQAEKEGVRKGLLNTWSVITHDDFFLGKQKFYLVIERPLSTALSFTIEMIVGIILVTILTGAGSLFLAITISRRFIRPINRLTQKAEQISSGDLIQPVNLDREDEFGALAQAFNSMSADIKKHIQSLNQHLIEKEAAYQSLTESYAEMEEISYVTAHHLQEPVRVIANYAELVSQKYKDRFDETGHRYLDHIQRKGAVLRKQLTDIMLYLSLSQMGAKKEPVAVNTLVSETLGYISRMFPEKAVTFQTRNLPELNTDSRLLEKVFSQLISNALKYNDKTNPEIEISTERVEDGWIFSVCDDGIGIDPQYQEKIFRMFIRLHSDQQYPGTGIGLTICRKIISMLGGKWIRIESANHGGTCVKFHLPE